MKGLSHDKKIHTHTLPNALNLQTGAYRDFASFPVGNPSHRATTALARQFPRTLVEVRAMSIRASIPSLPVGLAHSGKHVDRPPLLVGLRQVRFVQKLPDREWAGVREISAWPFRDGRDHARRIGVGRGDDVR